MKKKSRIPKFKNIQEEARFWDTHSITNFENESEEVVIEEFKPAPLKQLRNELEATGKYNKKFIDSLTKGFSRFAKKS